MHGQGAFDAPRIMLHNVHYSYNDDPSELNGRPFKFDLDSGALYAVRSDKGVGKSTFLRLIARQLVPTKGFITFPDRWRVRLVDTPIIFSSSVLENLRFGNNFDHPEVACSAFARVHTLTHARAHAHVRTCARTRTHVRTHTRAHTTMRTCTHAPGHARRHPCTFAGGYLAAM